MSSQEVQLRCQDHPDNILERYCTTCTKSACKDCDHFMTCYTEKHDTKPYSVDEFYINVTEVIKSIKDVNQELETIFNSIISDDREFKSHADYINRLIVRHVECVVKQVKEEGDKLRMDLKTVCTQREEFNKSQVNELESHRMQLQSMKTSVTEMTDKPESKIILAKYKSDVEDAKQNINQMKDKFSSYVNNLTPNFSINTELNADISKGLGKIKSVDNRYSIIEDDKNITVTEGQQFSVKVENVNECDDTCTLSGTLITPSRDNIGVDEVEFMGSGNYKIKGRCNEEGEWKMEITNGVSSVKGSPVNITVVPTLVRTIEDIQSLKKDNGCKVTDVKLDNDGCMLVSSHCNELLKFNKSGSFIANIQIPDVNVYKIHKVGNSHFAFSDGQNENVAICTNTFEVISTVGQGILEYPVGLAVNIRTRNLYVADREKHYVYQFDIDDERLIRKIGSMDTLDAPHDVIITREDHLLVPDWKTHKIQMFNSDGEFMKTIVSGGKEDGKVWNPKCIVMDKYENLIVVSDHKLQLFDKTGIFIKRIDDVNDNIDTPGGITVISYNPRRLAVANFGTNNVKIFNY
ncbi:uncharacterized protein [Antedon mediterranea]|uniref:uncharacterized protein n=1 Tax=Antedon mediterranea TaxID=105859 RepID=UPI003AF7A3C3